jgi:uncharacterized protein
MRTARRLSFLCVLASIFVLPITIVAALPKPDGFVNDFAGALTPETKTALDALVRDVEQQTSAEIAVATVPSLEGMTVEEYANRLFREWGIGKKGQDNGVLVLVATGERKMRIEVGYGLEPILPDGLAGEIIRTDFLPQFRSDNYDGGILQGVRRVADIIRRKHVVTDGERAKLAAAAEDRPPAFVMVPFFGIFIALGFFSLGLGLRSKTVFPIIWGGLFGGIPFLMSLVPFFNASIYLLGPLALGMAAWGWRKGRSGSFWGSTLRSSSRGGRRSARWVMGTDSSSSSGSGSGSGGGGGGGSFGGGSSGGGGASGSW